MTLPKKLLFYSLLLLLTLAAVEGMSRIAWYLAYGEWYRAAVPTGPAAVAGLNPGEYPEPLTRGGRQRIIHPYYGFSDFHRDAPLNLMPPWRTGEDTVIIGVLGGSVAVFATGPFRQAVEQYFAEQGLTKKPIVLDLSMLALRQPQQLDIVSHLLAMGGGFDIIVNLDGWNELAQSYDNYQRGVFPFFPHNWDALNRWTIAEVTLIGRIQFLRDELAALQRAGQRSPLRRSAVYGLINRYRSQRLENRILQLNYDLAATETGYSLERHGPAGNFSNAAEVHREAVRVWYRASALLGIIADRAGADYYHFLQPNQYVPDSKPLSAEELRHFYNPDYGVKADFPKTYPLLVRYGQELQRQGVNYFDLTQIFADHPETLYRDGCCHLNGRGSDLLGAAMAQRMEPALLRHGGTAAANAEVDATADSILAVAAPPPASPPPPPTPRVRLRGAAARAALAIAEWQVHRRPGNALEYVKEPCFSEHLQARFFMHITPVSVADLPENRQEPGFENWDFRFYESGGIHIDRYCTIERQLPDYPIARIRTGQYTAAGETWVAELSLTE